VQQQARTARYGILARQCAALDAQYLLTGHHRDDQVETVLFRLSRNSGLVGLRGMQATRRLVGSGAGVMHARPLLDASKAQLLQHCRASGVGWVEDASNRSSKYLRNRVRHAVEALSQEDPLLHSRLQGLALFWAAAGRQLALEMARARGDCVAVDILLGSVEVDCIALRTYSPPAQRATVSAVLQAVAGRLLPASDDQVSRVLQLAGLLGGSRGDSITGGIAGGGSCSSSATPVAVAGCLVGYSASGRLQVIRQPPSAKEPVTRLQRLPAAGQGIWWDKRFWIQQFGGGTGQSVEDEAADSIGEVGGEIGGRQSGPVYYVRALTKQDLRLLAADPRWARPAGHVRQAMLSLPVITDASGYPLSVPGMGYNDAGVFVRWSPTGPLGLDDPCLIL